MSDPKILEQITIQRRAGIGDEQIRKVLHIEGFSDPEIEQALKDASATPAPLPGQAAPSAPPAAPILTQTMPSPVPRPVSQPISAPSASVPAMQTMPAPHHSYLKIFSSIIVILLCLLAAGGAAYAYMQKIGPFAHVPYSEKDLISGILDATTRINSNSYSVSAAISVVPRDPDAYPFSIQVSNRDEMITKYGNDYKRVQSAMAIINAIRLSVSRGQKLPSSLSAIVAGLPSYQTPPSINDPATGLPYSYARSADGKDFALTMVFETPEAIKAIQDSGKYFDSTTAINGQTVTFNKGSGTFFSVSADPPMPYLEQLSEWMRFLSPDISADLTASASADWTNAEGEWKFNIDANGNLGDLSYKINVDALKKNSLYFVRVNNLPSIFAGPFSSVKGVWIKIDPAALASTSTASSLGMYSSVASQIPEAETKYKADRAELSAFVKTVAQIADEEGLIALKGAPQSERVDGTLLYRYDLDVRKDAVLPFYQRMVQEAAKNKGVSDYNLFNDAGTVEYLQSDEFSQVFDYMEQNVKISLWVDPAGYPEKLTYTMRVVPPDTATQLKDKQVMLTFTTTLSNINQPVTIDEPTDSKPVQDIISELMGNVNYSLDDARTSGRDAQRIADIKQIQLALELYRSDHKSAYPTKLSALIPDYVPAIPNDPSTGTAYTYAALGATCSHYHLGAVLEDANTALSTDADDSATSVCKGSAADFSGTSASCSTSPGTSERCFDVSDR